MTLSTETAQELQYERRNWRAWAPFGPKTGSSYDELLKWQWKAREAAQDAMNEERLRVWSSKWRLAGIRGDIEEAILNRGRVCGGLDSWMEKGNV